MLCTTSVPMGREFIKKGGWGTRQRRAGRGTGNRGRGTGNRKPGHICGRKARREQELRVRSAECGMQSEKLKQRQRRRSHAKATGGQAGGEETAKTAVGGQRPGIGIRKPGTRLRSGKPELRRAGQGTGNPPEKPGGQARGDTRALAAMPRLVSLCAARSYVI